MAKAINTLAEAADNIRFIFIDTDLLFPIKY